MSHIGFWGQNVNVYILYCTFHLYVMCKKGFLVKKKKWKKVTPAGVVCINHHPITSQGRARVLCTFLSKQNSNLLLNNLSKCYCIVVLPSYFSSRVTNNFGVSWIMPSLIWTYLIINGFIFFSSFQPAFWIENSRGLGKKLAWIAFYLR